MTPHGTIAFLLVGLFAMFVLAIWLWDSRDYWRGRYTALSEFYEHEEKMRQTRAATDAWKASRN